MGANNVLKHKYLFLLYSILFFTLLAFSLIFPLGFDDSYNLQVSEHLVQNNQYATNFGIFDIQITTGFPVLLPIALIFKLFSIGIIQVRIVMILFFLSLLSGCFLLIKELGISDNKKAILCIILSFFIWLFTVENFFAHIFNALGEFPSLLFFVYSCIYLQKYTKGQKLKYAALSGILLGLAISTKYIMIAAALSIVLPMFAYAVYNKKGFSGLITLISFLFIPEVLFQIYHFISVGYSRFITDWINMYSYYINLDSNFGRSLPSEKLFTHLYALNQKGFQNIFPVVLLVGISYFIFVSYKSKKFVLLCLTLFAAINYIWWFFLSTNLWLRHLVMAEMVTGLIFSYMCILLLLKFKNSTTKRKVLVIPAILIFVGIVSTFSFQILAENLDIHFYLKLTNAQKTIARFIDLNRGANYYFPLSNQATEIAFLTNRKFFEKTTKPLPYKNNANYLIFTYTQLNLSPGTYSFFMKNYCKKIVIESFRYKLCRI